MQPSLIFAVFAFFLLGSVAVAQEKPAGKPSAEKKDEKKEPLKDHLVTTEHSGTFGGEKIDYAATAGTMVISKQEEEPKAAMFFVAYEKKGVKDPAARPVVFCFNGGPGSSGVWLHLGGFGPKRVAMNADGTMPAPPFSLKENPDSLLKVADLVFIDPVSTGYSRAEDKKKAGDFHGFKGDLESMAEFIRLYTTRNERWLSPKFLAGESYGAFRAAGLAHRLHDSYGLYLNGVVLVSGVLSFDTLWGSDLSYITFLPSLSEVAAYHKRLAPELLKDPEARRAEVETFAFGEYASALLKGTRLGDAEKEDIAARISRYTGIGAEAVKEHELRLSAGFFREELLRDDGMILGRFDARIKGADGNLAGNSPDYDPSYQAVYGPFSAALNDYVRRDLKFESDLVYEILTDHVRPWKYGDEFVGQPVNVLDDLAAALIENPSLKILVDCGYQDLATPFAAIRQSIDHLDVPPGTLDRVSYRFYTGGHMMYTIEESNAAWNRDVTTFIQENAGTE